MNDFKRIHRLIKKSDYDPLFEKSNKNRIYQPYFLILFKPNKRQHPRLGLIIAKQHIRHAVARNRIKRIVRETFRLNQSQLKGLDVIFLAKKACDPLTRQALREHIELVWKKLSKYSLSLF